MGFKYPMIEPPFEWKPYREMSKGEAQRAFEWFTSLRDPRCEIMRQAIEAQTIDLSWFDYSRNSLVPLWKWAATNFGIRTLTAEEREKYRQSAPGWFQKVESEPTELNSATKTLIMDLGFYFAKMFMIRYPQVQWAIWKKKDSMLNKAYLTGFTLQLEPRAPIQAAARAYLRGVSDSKELQKKYDIWVGNLVS